MYYRRIILCAFVFCYINLCVAVWLKEGMLLSCFVMSLRRAYAPNGEAWSYERFIIKFGNAGGPMFFQAEKAPDLPDDNTSPLAVTSIRGQLSAHVAVGRDVRPRSNRNATSGAFHPEAISCGACRPEALGIKPAVDPSDASQLTAAVVVAPCTMRAVSCGAFHPEAHGIASAVDLSDASQLTAAVVVAPCTMRAVSCGAFHSEALGIASAVDLSDASQLTASDCCAAPFCAPPVGPPHQVAWTYLSADYNYWFPVETAVNRFVCQAKEPTLGAPIVAQRCRKPKCCLRCAAQVQIEDGWEDPVEYKLAAAIIMARIKAFICSSPEDFQIYRQAMADHGGFGWLLLVAAALNEGSDKPISHFGVVALEPPASTAVIQNHQLGGYYVQRRWSNFKHAYEYFVSFDPGNALYYNWVRSLRAYALTFGMTGKMLAAMFARSINHSQNMEKVADVVEASLGVAIVALRIKELNEYLTEILPVGCSISSLYHSMCHSIRHHNQGGGGSSSQRKKKGAGLSPQLRLECLSLTFLSRYYTGVWEKDGPLQISKGSAIQLGASQPEFLAPACVSVVA